MHTEKLTIEEILATRHPQLKEVMIEKYGLGNFVEAQDHTILDKVKVDGSVYQLISVDIREREKLVVLKVTCPSTKKKYYLRVPPRFRNFKDALAWTFNISTYDLDFYLET